MALTEKREEKSQLQTEIVKYRECDPEVVEGVRKQGDMSKDAANRWTGWYCIRRTGKGEEVYAPASQN